MDKDLKEVDFFSANYIFLGYYGCFAIDHLFSFNILGFQFLLQYADNQVTEKSTK